MNGIVAKLDLNIEFKSIGSVNIFLYAIACNLCTSILANKECNSCSVVLSQGLFCPAVEVSISRWGKMQGTTVVIVVIVNWMQLLNICFPFRLWPWFSRHHTTFLCPQNSYIRVNECEQVGLRYSSCHTGGGTHIPSEDDLGFTPGFSLNSKFLFICSLGGSKWWHKCLGHYHPHQKPGISP